MTEPVLDGSEIQGDSLAGFKKDHARLVFVSFDPAKVAPTREWLAAFADQLAYLEAVHGFNLAFKALRRTRHAAAMSVTWKNIALTFEGIKLLAPDADFSALDPSFKVGAAANASVVGDPTDGSKGDPRTWIIGRPEQHVHAMITVAGDDAQDVAAKTTALTTELAKLMSVVLVQEGDTRQKDVGHEHFGFKDGISQPGVRGVVGPHGALVTERLLDSGDPLAADFAAPGKPLLWPGEFVLGYPKKVTGATDPNKTVTDQVPAWMKNGSYSVFRMLRQDVPGFASAVAEEAQRIAKLPGFAGLSSDRLGALVVGRWKSGTPVMRSPLVDDAAIAGDTEASNSFFYVHDTAAPKYTAASRHAPDPPQRAKADSLGQTCPLGAHIRKVNPRDETTDQGVAARTLEHRILRRGLPYGPDYDATQAGSAAQDRGLLFICYQASIRSGFEFLSRTWANAEDAPDGGGGQDLVIGQTGAAVREMFLKDAGGNPSKVSMPRFVTAQGGLYLFAPSRAALKLGFHL
jgi:Dyp-type peroxidase family